MKTTRNAVAILVVLAGTLAALPAFAGPYYHGGYHHGYYGPRVSFGFGFGAPYAYPYYYPPYYAPYSYPAYYSSPVVVQQSPVYVEQNSQPAPSAPSAQQPAPAGYWYYCADSRAYYPYVKECQAGWQRVAPQPG